MAYLHGSVESLPQRCDKSLDEIDIGGRSVRKIQMQQSTASEVGQSDDLFLFNYTENLVPSLLPRSPDYGCTEQDDYPFDVLCFSEHFLNQGCLNQIHIPGYMLACYYCRSVRERGGVCIFIKNNIKFKPLCFKEFNTERDSEFCGLDLGECVIVCTYRSSCCPDRRPYLRNLEALLSKLYNKPNTKKVIIMGDFNFHFNVPSHDLTQLLNLIESFGLNQTIFKPTRNHNCLDNILTDFSDNNFKSDIFDASVSDHSGQFILFKIGEVRKISVGGLNRLRESISNHDWSSFMGENQDVDFLGRALTDFYTSSIKNNFPVLIKSHQNSAPLVNWFTDKLKHMRKQLEIMKSISNIIGCPRYNDFTKFLSKEYKNEIRLSKQQVYDSLFLNAKNKAKVAWKIINTERNKKGMSVSDSMLSSELLNTFFSGVAKVFLFVCFSESWKLKASTIPQLTDTHLARTLNKTPLTYDGSSSSTNSSKSRMILYPAEAMMSTSQLALSGYCLGNPGLDTEAFGWFLDSITVRLHSGSQLSSRGSGIIKNVKTYSYSSNSE
nr:unnamed protein product [Callosobruchus analis]